jgi:hypothetical protein
MSKPNDTPGPMTPEVSDSGYGRDDEQIEHDWSITIGKDATVCCAKCGRVRRADGQNRPCPGKMPSIRARYMVRTI